MARWKRLAWNHDTPIDSIGKIRRKSRGANGQDGHDKETSALKEHHDVTLDKTLANVKVPENVEKWRDFDKLRRIGTNIKLPSMLSLI